MAQNEDNSGALYLLAGFGLGAIFGVIGGILFAPKSGKETRDELTDKVKELKGKTEEWVAEQKAKRAAADVAEKLGL